MGYGWFSHLDLGTPAHQGGNKKSAGGFVRFGSTCFLMESDVNPRFTTGWWFGCHFLFFHILGMSSSQLTNIFQRGGPTTNQINPDGFHLGSVLLSYDSFWLPFGDTLRDQSARYDLYVYDHLPKIGDRSLVQVVDNWCGPCIFSS